jgi:tetraacyldisaccharide 4'-kinase
MSPRAANPHLRATFPLLWPFTLPYAIAARLKNCAYDRHWLQPKKLSWPVVSVGNLSVGGTGKTPLVLLLAHRLSQRGWIVDVLSRGYGRSRQIVAHVDPTGTPEEFGDEPLMMARHGLSVYVGTNRYNPGQLAEKKAESASLPSRRMHILDDGFQHRKLAREVDIVLLQRADLEGQLLPAGRLRESLGGLRRADIFILRAEDADLSERVMHLMDRRAHSAEWAKVWIMERRTTLPSSPDSIPAALAFCAIGDATGFFNGLRQAGLALHSTIAFRDHHIYNPNDIEDLQAAARRCRAKCFVTTEKDSMRLPPPLRAKLEKQGPLLIAGLEISLQQEKDCLDGLEALLHERLQIPPRNVR